MINSQLGLMLVATVRSISKGIGDQFSAGDRGLEVSPQYIKGDR